MSAPETIRRESRPGDLDRIVEHHARVYPREYGVGTGFVDHVAGSVAGATGPGWPGERERLLIVELDGRHAGSLGLTDDGEDGWGHLRWFLLDPAVRGHGLGRAMVDELVDHARESGYAGLRLDTFSELRAAAHLYRSRGFEVVREETGPRWGRDEITYQIYEARFQRRAQDRSSRSAGESATPFSVSA